VTEQANVPVEKRFSLQDWCHNLKGRLAGSNPVSSTRKTISAGNLKHKQSNF